MVFSHLPVPLAPKASQAKHRLQRLQLRRRARSEELLLRREQRLARDTVEDGGFLWGKWREKPPVVGRERSGDIHYLYI